MAKSHSKTKFPASNATCVLLFLGGLATIALPGKVIAEDGGRQRHKILDSVILGGLAHDVGEAEAGGIDPNIELRFASPFEFSDHLRVLPTVGGTANFDDGANTVYLGGTLQFTHDSGFYVEGFFGFAGHTADTPVDSNEANLGCKVLFREAAEAGYRWEQHRIGAIVAHYSNGDVLCSSDQNDGLTQIGVRYGLQF